MPPAPSDTPDAFLHRVIDDQTAVRALATLARHALIDGDTAQALAHLAHLDRVVMRSAACIQAYRVQHDPAPLGFPPLCVN